MHSAATTVLHQGQASDLNHMWQNLCTCWQAQHGCELLIEHRRLYVHSSWTVLAELMCSRFSISDETHIYSSSLPPGNAMHITIMIVLAVMYITTSCATADLLLLEEMRLVNHHCQCWTQ